MRKGISSETIYRTEDGTKHDTIEMAEHWLVLKAIHSSLLDHGLCGSVQCNPDTSDITNWIESNAQLVRDFLDASDKMQKASLT